MRDVGRWDEWGKTKREKGRELCRGGRWTVWVNGGIWDEKGRLLGSGRRL